MHMKPTFKESKYIKETVTKLTVINIVILQCCMINSMQIIYRQKAIYKTVNLSNIEDQIDLRDIYGNQPHCIDV